MVSEFKERAHPGCKMTGLWISFVQFAKFLQSSIDLRWSLAAVRVQYFCLRHSLLLDYLAPTDCLQDLHVRHLMKIQGPNPSMMPGEGKDCPHLQIIADQYARVIWRWSGHVLLAKQSPWRHVMLASSGIGHQADRQSSTMHALCNIYYLHAIL